MHADADRSAVIAIFFWRCKSRFFKAVRTRSDGIMYVGKANCLCQADRGRLALEWKRARGSRTRGFVSGF